MFLGLQDPDPSINKQKYYDKPWFLLFCDFSMTSYLWKKKLDPDPYQYDTDPERNIGSKNKIFLEEKYVYREQV